MTIRQLIRRGGMLMDCCRDTIAIFYIDATPGNEATLDCIFCAQEMVCRYEIVDDEKAAVWQLVQPTGEEPNE